MVRISGKMGMVSRFYASEDHCQDGEALFELSVIPVSCTMEQERAVIKIGEERIYAMIGSEKPTPNAATAITIRPERIIISSPGERERPGVSGTITEIVYIGTDVRYLLKIATGQEIQIRIQNSSKEDISAFPKGAEVQISRTPEDAKLLSD